MRNRPPREPKPYALVDIPQQAPRRTQAVTHQRFSGLTGQLKLAITVVSEYLFVGSGAFRFNPRRTRDQPDVWYTFCRTRGRMCIPGTSLKGAIRSIVEVISNSCVSQRKSGETIPEPHRPCRFRDPNAHTLCPACRLFGATGLRGRVWFSDAVAEPRIKTEVVKIGELWRPHYQATAGKRRFYQVKATPRSDKRPQRNFRFVEVVCRGGRFLGRCGFENVCRAELGLILSALGLSDSRDGQLQTAFTPKLGGGKPRCLGAARIEVVEARILDPAGGGILGYVELRGDELRQFLSNCLRACREEGMLHRPSWDQLVAGLQPRTGSCPKEVY